MKINFTLNQLDLVIQTHILPLLAKQTILTFTGPLGAGKTTMIKEVLRQCGVTQSITSPTFGYVNSYKSATGTIFNHFDLYRIASIDEFLAAGFDEYLYRQGNISFIEWPNFIDELLKLPEVKKKVVHIKISYVGDDVAARVLEIDFGRSYS